MSQRGTAMDERDVEVTLRFPVHPMTDDERRALAAAFKDSDYRLVHTDDLLATNLGAGAGAGPYVIIDFFLPVVQHAGGDVLGIAVLAGLKKALDILRGSHPHRILQIRVAGRRTVAYRLTREVDVEAALRAIPGDYASLPRRANDREWVDGKWSELPGSHWVADTSAPEGFLLPTVRGVANFLRRTLFVSSWFEQRLRARGAHAARLMVVEGEMLAWLALFVLALWLVPPRVGPATWVLGFLAGLRILNVFGYSLYSVLYPSTAAGMTPFASLRRTVLMNLVNFLTVWAAFAFIYRTIIVSTSGAWFKGTQAADSLAQSAYLSWATLLTLGSDYPAQNAGAQGLVAVELGIGLVILAVTLAAVLGSLKMEEATRV